MGFLRRLFGRSRKKSSGDPKRSNIRSLDHKSRPTDSGASSYGDLDANKHAIAVAAATAAVAEAALAAAQAAAEVVRLTGGSAGAAGRAAFTARPGGARARPSLEELAPLRIQSAFRGYLARRALRALKALVKLQALVRGRIVRKQMADMLRRMQTLVRVQARARASHRYPTASSVSSTKLSSSQNPRSPSTANYRDSIEIDRSKFGSVWLDRWMENSTWDNGSSGIPPRSNKHEDERTAKILEIDTWKPHFNSRTNQGSVKSSSNHGLDPDETNKTFVPFDSPSKYSSQPPYPEPTPSSEEAVSLMSLNFPKRKDERFRSAEDSPQVVSGPSRPGSRRGPFSPTRSEYSWGYFNGYSGHPNYMANTESSRAKLRSQSAPRQRHGLDRYGSSKSAALHRSWDGGHVTSSERSYPMNADFKKSTYKVSNRFNHPRNASIR